MMAMPRRPQTANPYDCLRVSTLLSKVWFTETLFHAQNYVKTTILNYLQAICMANL